jgi:hypothetical protein
VQELLLEGECDDEECWYTESVWNVFIAQRVVSCVTGEESAATDFYNALYDDWFWDENGPPVLNP